MKLSIIILSYNTKNLTFKCIASIVSHYRQQLENGTFELIVVDNASTDGTVEELRNRQQEIGRIKIVENHMNFGFSKGNNVGTKKAQGKYILFLNSDTEVNNDGFLGMVTYLDEKTEIAVLGGRMINRDGSYHRSTGKFYTIPYLVLMLFGFERLGFVRPEVTKLQSVDWVSGACLMVRRDIFLRLGGFDEHLFMYLEDMEFCYRVRKAGFAIYFYPFTQMLHVGQGSSSRSFAIIQLYKNLLYFYKKHTSTFQYNLVRLLLVAKGVILSRIGALLKIEYLQDTYSKALKSI